MDLNLNTILQIITLLGVLFAIFQFFRKPQEKAETIDAVFGERMNNYEKTTQDAIKLALNHSHSVEAKLDLHISQSNAKGIDDARWQGKIETLLEERLTKQ